jgi:flagellin
MPDYDVTRIAGNIGAMNALNSLSNINKQLATYQARLATGKRINSAADDPAGLTIATKMQARSEGLKVALGNIGDAKNLLAVAEAGLGRINDILVQMRNKAEAGASDTMGVKEREALMSQMKAYATQIDDIVAQTKWTSSSASLIGGAYLSNNLTFQTGADSGDVTYLSGLKDMRASGGANSLNLTTTTNTNAAASNFLGVISDSSVSVNRANGLGELSTGTYLVKVTQGGTNGDASIVQLFSGSDASMSNPLTIAANPAGTGVTATSVQVDLDGQAQTVDFGNGLSVQIAADSGAATRTGSVSYTKSTAGVQLRLANGSSLDASSATAASDFAGYMSLIESKLDDVSSQLSMIGALTGRLTFKEDQVSNAQINTEAAYNRIMNANMAEEQVNASKYQILQQTATAMLAQANAAPQFLLSLFR